MYLSVFISVIIIIFHSNRQYKWHKHFLYTCSQQIIKSWNMEMANWVHTPADILLRSYIQPVPTKQAMKTVARTIFQSNITPNSRVNFPPTICSPVLIISAAFHFRASRRNSAFRLVLYTASVTADPIAWWICRTLMIDD